MGLSQNGLLKYEQEEFVAGYLDSIWQGVLNQKLGYIFFNITAENFSKQIEGYISNFKQQAFVVSERLVNNKFEMPYYPFLKYLKDYLEDIDESEIDRYVEDAEVYHLHKPIFINFLKGKRTRRDEELILEELKYEQEEMLSSIVKLLVKLSQEVGPLLFLVESLELAQESTFKLIDHIITHDYKGKVMFIFSLNKSQRSLMSDTSKRYWDNFIKKIEINNILIDLNNSPQVRGNLVDNSVISSLKIEELIFLGAQALNLLAIGEAKNYLLQAYNLYQQIDSKLDEENHINLFILLGDLYNYLDEDDKALINYQMVADYLRKNDKSLRLALAFRKMALIHLKKYNLETAERLVEQSLKLSLNKGDKEQLFQSYFLICLIQERQKKYSSIQWLDLYEKMVKLGKELKSYNTLASFYTHFHYSYHIELVEQDNKDIIEKVKGFDKLEKADFDINEKPSIIGNRYYKEILKIAKEYNNRYRLATAYQLRAIICDGLGEKEKVLEYYKKSEKIKEKLNIKLQLSYTYNGLGYHYFTLEDYLKAYDYHNKALYCLREVKDYHEIAMTCLNQGINLLFAREYKGSIYYLNNLLELLSGLQLEVLMYQSQGKIYSILGIDYLKRGNLVKAEEYILKLKFEENHKKSGDIFEPFFIELFSALYHKEKENYQLSKESFYKAKLFLSDVGFSKDYIYPLFYYEYGLMYEKFNQKEKAKGVFNKGLEFCKKLNYSFYKNLLLNRLGANEEVEEFNFKEFNFDFDWIIESAELGETLNKFHNQINKVEFLNRLQNILVKTSQKEELINKVMKLIEYNFLAEKSGLYLREGGEWKNYFFSDNDLPSKFKIESFIEKMLEGGEERLINAQNEGPQLKKIIGEFNSIIFIPLKRREEVSGCLFCCTRSGDLELTVDDLQILSILTKQLSIALERVDKDNELKRAYDELNNSYQEVLKLSKTDFLTELYNRLELMKRLSQEKSRILHNKNSDCKYYSVMYIDLDNFKYCNDRFGHSIGDLILCKFARLLEETIRGIDFASRFGGDEFVIVLPESKAEDAYIVAKRIQERLIESNQFRGDLETELNQKLEIPLENRLTCSIGVAENNLSNNFSNDELLKRADKALYIAKGDGKNKVEIWKE